MKHRIIMALLALPLAAAAQPADNPKAAPNPAANRYVAVPGFFKMPAGRAMGASSAVAGDSKGNIWVVDRCGANNCTGSKLDPVMEFDTSGKLLRTMGKVGMAGSGPDRFTEPNAVLVAPDGSLFVAEGHTRDYKGHPRIIKFDRNGKFVKQWGSPGAGPGQFGMPHCLAMDTAGRLYVGDRDNNRIQ
ncbi:MAG TPA: hypothetical protein VK515_01820, partial [Rhizomicrobium sp.]|nr:hypothetical protein [Rhizomicrobium sp.]